MKRTGCIYSEFTNKGRSSTRYVRGCKPVRGFRVKYGEIQINGKRYRFRSTNHHNVRFWLDVMIAKSDDSSTYKDRQQWKQQPI